jgi:ABC-type Fe3+/spermidine/putrescine transport system ATPase subunit
VPAVPASPVSPVTPPTPTAQLFAVSKRYRPDAPPAVDRLTLDVEEGEFLFLLGPSGSGKTTALRLLGGYETPDAGTVVLQGTVANRVPAHRRNVGMVFQGYALFPHLTVAQNVAFGLRMRGAPRREQAARVGWALGLVRLSGLEARLPHELSGGQQQRVALARAVAFGPALLLLDEPFANLDRHLRDELRGELKALQRRLRLTTVFVTHDQEEALSMADRIAVLDHGRLEQAGPPAALYTRPRSRFVAAFLGEVNLLPGTLDGPLPDPDGELRRAHVLGVPVVVSPPAGAQPADGQPRRGDAVTICLRAERLRLAAAQETAQRITGGVGTERPAAWPGQVELVTYLGAHTRYVVRLDAGPAIRVVEANADDAPPWRPGETVRVVATGPAAGLLGEHPPAAHTHLVSDQPVRVDAA